MREKQKSFNLIGKSSKNPTQPIGQTNNILMPILHFRMENIDRIKEMAVWKIEFEILSPKTD